MKKLRTIQQTNEVLESVCGCVEYEIGLLTQVLTFQEKLSLSKFTQHEMLGLQELLFRIMTTSYDLISRRIIDGVILQNAIAEAVAVLNQHQLPRYSGNYDALVREYNLTPLHLKVLSRKMSVHLINCADSKNTQLSRYRQDQRKYLNNRDVALTFQEFMRHEFSFEDTIYIMHQYTLQQIKDFKNNAKELDSAVSWVKDTLMQDYKMPLDTCMQTLTSMVMRDKPLPPHIDNLASPFRRQFQQIYSADFNHRYGMETVSQADNVTTVDCCRFLEGLSQPTRFTPYEESITTETCENLVVPMSVMVLGAMGALCLLFANSNCLKRISVSAYSLFTDCKRKRITQHPSPQTEMDVDSEAAIRKTA